MTNGRAVRANRVPATYELPVVVPYRLDLTVTALRRTATNVVDVMTDEGEYLRVLAGPDGSTLARVRQTRADALAVTLEGSGGARVLATVRRMLGVDRELTRFYRAAARIPWLSPLARRMRGLKPPRYPSLWEACVNAIVFQQVSLGAASAITRRLVIALGVPVEHRGVTLYAFPSAETFEAASDRVLRATGLSANKLATLRRAAAAILSGDLDEAALETRSSEEAAALLRRVKGIGPWTATVILLRGLGRLDVFPMNDTGVAKSVAIVAGSAAFDVEQALAALGQERGMLYYHLLLGRLEARGRLTLGPRSSSGAGRRWSRARGGETR